MRRFLMLLLAIIFSSVANAQQVDSVQVVIFLSEKCPICQSITLELERLTDEFADKPVSFVGLFPKDISSEKTVKAFKKKYKISFPLAVDKNGTAATKLKATITPEVFVMNKASGNILYSGRVDNSFESLGKRRAVVTEHYLEQALRQIFNHQAPDPAQTQAVGCLIL